MPTPENGTSANREIGGFARRSLRFDNLLSTAEPAPSPTFTNGGAAAEPPLDPAIALASENPQQSLRRQPSTKPATARDAKKPSEAPSAQNTARRDDPVEEQMQKIRRSSYLSTKGIDPNAPHQLDLLFKDEMGCRTDLRHLPNDLARTSLYTTRNNRSSEPRRALLHQKLFHYNEDIEIIYTGIELRAEDDELVWLQILKYSESVPMGQPFSFEIKDLVKDVGWARNGGNYERARECISRLKANEIQVRNSKAFGLSGAMSLIHSYTTTNDGEGQQTRFSVHIDKNMILLFAGNTFTSHAWSAYRKLTPTARRLADYVQSHKTPNPLDAEKFRKMCGSENTDPYNWRTQVRRACRELTDAGIAAFAKVDKRGMIIVQRAHSEPNPSGGPAAIE